MKILTLALALLGCAPPPAVHHPIENCVMFGAGPHHTAAFQGRWFDARRVSDLIPGDSTLDDAKCALGEPTLTTDSSNGTSNVTWMWLDGSKMNGVLKMNGATAMIIFDGATGKMVRIMSLTQTH